MSEGLCHRVVKGKVMGLKLKLLVLAVVFAGGFVAGASYIGHPIVVLPAPTAAPAPPAPSAQFDAYFCPEDKCSQHVIEAIDGAKSYVHVAIYSFTLDSIADALIRAKQRGVDVKVVIDKEQAGNKYSEDERLTAAGVEVKYDQNPALMHNKFLVVDGEVVGTGSFNWSKNADQENDENLLIVRSKELAAKYEAEFEEMWGGVFGK